jgi:hypothetical protein
MGKAEKIKNAFAVGIFKKRQIMVTMAIVVDF